MNYTGSVGPSGHINPNIIRQFLTNFHKFKLGKTNTTQHTKKPFIYLFIYLFLSLVIFETIEAPKQYISTQIYKV